MPACRPLAPVYGLVGRPVSRSLSPAIHCSVFERLGVPAYYTAWQPDDLEAFTGAARVLVAGFNVTIPFKEQVLGMLDHVAEDAAEIGAVNTVANRGGRLEGYNTDYLGVARCLEPGRGAGKALVVGAGGAARAAVYALARLLGVKRVAIVNRTPGRAWELARWASRRLGVEAVAGGLGDAELLGRGAEVVVNATPLGSGYCCPEEAPPVLGLLGPGVVVLDMVYYPLETRLLREARRRGARTVDGLCMLVWQALYADKLWLGVEPGEELYQHARSAALRELDALGG